MPTVARRLALLLFSAILLGTIHGPLAARVASAQEAQWIWSPEQTGNIPAGTCYFRKTFTMTNPGSRRNPDHLRRRYELFVNGQHVGKGENWKVLDVYDITKFLVRGPNTIAVKASNVSAALPASWRGDRQERRRHARFAHRRTATWKTTLKEFPAGENQTQRLRRWLAAAQSLARWARTLPWGERSTRRRRIEAAASNCSPRIPRRVGRRAERNRLADRDGVQRVRPDCCSREGGPLLIVRDYEQRRHARQRSPSLRQGQELPGHPLAQRPGVRRGRGSRRDRPVSPVRRGSATARSRQVERCSSSPARWASTARTRWCWGPTA